MLYHVIMNLFTWLTSKTDLSGRPLVQGIDSSVEVSVAMDGECQAYKDVFMASSSDESIPWTMLLT